ncbi:MAG TPA: efflux transporter outer membrane subunit [Rhodopila sp.]|nr:efflux transporter outer membrane subunit [Rhodopila sp.]
MIRSSLLGAASALILSACTVGPNFKPPKPPAVAAWNDLSKHPDPAVSPRTNPDPNWWKNFGDPVLTQVIDKAISGNLDLQQAVLRVVEARQAEINARAAGLPTVGGNASFMREQLGLKGLLLSQGVYGQLNTLANQGSPTYGISPTTGRALSSGIEGALGPLEAPVNLYSYGLGASWELDLFGRVRRAAEQAQAMTEAQIDATNDALVMLEGQVAQAYVQLRGAQALLASQQENVRTAQEALDLTRRRAREGLTTALDVDQAQTQLADYQSQLPGYEKQAQQAMNMLSVLTGEPPGALDAMLSPDAPLPKVPNVVSIGVPSTLARRRPDIRQAEAQLHAATANVGVAVASFYPDVSLTGNFGLRAVDASYLTNWASAFYSFGPGISLPIFQGGRLTAGLRAARAQQAGAALRYRSVVLNALREVEDALVAYRTDRTARDRLKQAVRSGQSALYLSRDAYDHGLATFLQVLDAERTLVGSRQQLVQADVLLTNDVVALYGALGGGWQDEPDATTPPDVALKPPPLPGAADVVESKLPAP